MADKDPYIPFSQRTGLVPVPSQLKLGEVSPELRRLLDYGIHLEVERKKRSNYYGPPYFDGQWKRVAQDLHVQLFRRAATAFQNDAAAWRKLLEQSVQKAQISDLFDLIEFFVRHPGCSAEFKADLADAFVRARAAYRIIDGQIVAIGTDQQAEAFEAAIAASEVAGADAARTHLIAAGAELRSGNWAGSVRESIHAVEAMAVLLVPDAKTLGDALGKLEKQGHLHRGLKKALGSLYGYANDERGVRHSLVFSDEAKVDETDALFMLGACASFVSYLIARSGAPEMGPA